MEQLTQEIFNDCPNWVKSAAVDGDGTAFYHDTVSAKLKPWLNVPFPTFKGSRYVQEIGVGFDATNWQNSAIDRKGYRCPKCDYHHSPHQCRECECINCYSLII